MVLHEAPVPEPSRRVPDIDVVAVRSRWFTSSKNGHYAYIAGPMRGIPEYNFPAFNQVAAEMRAIGYGVCNPAETSDEIVPDRFWSWDALTVEPWIMAEFLRVDLRVVTVSTLVVMLPGWENSRGARLEAAVAQACGVPTVIWPALTEVAPVE